MLRTPLLLLSAALVLLAAGCRLEDRSGDAEGGTLPSVQVGAPDPAAEGRPPGEDHAPPAELAVGPEFWHGGGTRALELTARFVSGEARRALLDPEGPVGRFDGREWRLSDLLVSVDYRGGATQARWQVAGPPEVIAAYLAGLRDHPADRTPLAELGVLEMTPRPEGP
jgi:hypothetical protein